MSTNPAPPPVFVLGFQRSGTTLMRLCLDAHPDLAIPSESFVLIDYWKRLGDYGGLSTSEQRARLVADLLGAKGIRLWQPRVEAIDIDLNRCTSYASLVDQVFSAYARRCGKSRWGDKTPSYTRDFHVLNELFPQAYFVHVIRDGRDVALSVARQRWGPSDAWTVLRQWNEVVAWSRKMGRMLPCNRYLEVRYEDLVTAPEDVLRRVAGFLSLEFHDVMLKFHEGALTKVPARAHSYHSNVARAMDPGLTYQWRHKLSPVDQAIAVELAGPLLTELGYPTDGASISRIRLHGRRLWHWASAAGRWRMRKVGAKLGWRVSRSDGGSPAQP